MTKFEYKVNGVPKVEILHTSSVWEYNKAINRLLSFADKDSLYATSIK